MIHKILLGGDNSQLVTRIINTLKTYNPSLLTDFIQADNIPSATLKADEVFVFINKNTKIPETIWNLTESTGITNVSAKPQTIAPSGSILIKNIAVQRHLMNVESERNIFLGELKNGPAPSEPYIRESSFFIFDMCALRGITYPSGLFSEDATQMFRYAGMNELNKVVIINQVSDNMDTLIAQFLWYYAEAAAIRFPDHPYFSNTVKEYVVEVDSLGLAISFYKSNSSGRWWVKVPDIPENKWKSCSYEDYTDACEDRLNPHLLDIISTV